MKKKTKTSAAKNIAAPRLPYIDSTRGFTVLLMVLVNFFAPYGVIPSWTKHAAGIGFTYVDMIAPMFVFIMGIASDFSFNRRMEKDGTARALGHYFLRYGLLFFFGMAGTLVQWLTEHIIDWIVFQTLGVAGVIALPFLFIKKHEWRIVAALALMAAYQAVFNWWLGGLVFADFGQNGVFLRGFVQSIALAGLAVFGSGLAKWARNGRIMSAAPAWGGVFLAAGMGLSFVIPPNRPMGSLTYLFFGLGLGCVFLTLFFLAHDKFKLAKIPVLQVLGRNALLMFMIAGVAGKLLLLAIPEKSAVLPVLIGAVAIETVCIVTAKVLDMFNITVKL